MPTIQHEPLPKNDLKKWEISRLLALQSGIAKALLQAGSLQETLLRCTDLMVASLEAAFVRVWILNSSDNILELKASSGRYTHLDGAHSRIKVGQYKIGLIAEQRLPHLTNEVIGDPRISDQEWAKREGMIAFAGYPLLVEDSLLGVLGMFSTKSLSPSTLETIASIANLFALGIQRKLNEDSSTEDREFLQQVLSSSSECVKVLDLDFHIKYMNANGMKLLEIDDFGDCKDADWCSFWKPEDLPAIKSAIEAATAGNIGLFDASCPTFKGTPKWWEVVISPIHDARGKVVRLLASSRDVTTRKQMEISEQQNAERLRSMVEERTTKLRYEVIERKKAEDDLRKLTSQLLSLRDDERRRIARDLHDSLGQVLTAATMTLASVSNDGKPFTLKSEKALLDTSELIQQALQEVRVVSQILHPPLLDEAGLSAALRNYIEGISARGTVEMSLIMVEDFGRLTTDLETAIFRIVQECLTNVHRHSGSKTALVTIVRLPQEISVQVSDEGRGMSPEGIAGVGLRGMRERVAQFGGTLDVKSDDKGTTVTARLPAAL